MIRVLLAILLVSCNAAVDIDCESNSDCSPFDNPPNCEYYKCAKSNCERIFFTTCPPLIQFVPNDAGDSGQ